MVLTPTLKSQSAFDKPPLTVYLAAPRGFCAGVDRAIQMVERALDKYGAPVYVRHEIVHNKYVVDGLRQRGAVFIKELDEIPAGSTAPVIFSAHGAPKSVPQAAEARQLFYLDATCPLVSKVHRETERHFKNGLHIILIGHKGHPEVVGTMGQLPDGAVQLIETVDDIGNLCVPDPLRLAYVTQTTLSVDDTAAIIAALESRFPGIVGPYKEDICYATTNRQAAVKSIAQKVDALLVIGAPNSSNSNRLAEVAVAYGAPRARLIQTADEIDWDWLGDITTLGLTAGASAPEILVTTVIDAVGARYAVTLVSEPVTIENVEFKLPRQLSTQDKGK